MNTTNPRAAYEVACIVGEIIQWWQAEHPEIKQVSVGYDLMGGPSVGIWWVGGTNKRPDDIHEYCNLEVCGWNAKTVINIFTRSINQRPALK